LDTLTFLSFLNIVGKNGTFWVNAFLSLIAWWFIYALVPETKGISLEEIKVHRGNQGHIIS